MRSIRPAPTRAPARATTSRRRSTRTAAWFLRDRSLLPGEDRREPVVARRDAALHVRLQREVARFLRLVAQRLHQGRPAGVFGQRERADHLARIPRLVEL